MDALSRRNLLRGGLAAAAIAGTTVTAGIALTSSELDRLIAELAIARAEVDKYDADADAAEDISAADEREEEAMRQLLRYRPRDMNEVGRRVEAILSHQKLTDWYFEEGDIDLLLVSMTGAM